jgi:sortase A
VAGLLLATQLGWPLAASPSGGSTSLATPSAVTPFASYPGSATSSLPVVVGSPRASEASPTASGSPFAIVANRIVISRLGIDVKIVEGDGWDAPLGRAAHYPGTAWPGGGSNIYLYAHARTGMFINLWNARIGDEIVLTLVDGSQRRYVVSQILPKVTWNDMSVLAPTPTEQLTLQTCIAYQQTAPRFVVIAVPEQ